jgi:hypothetical protein
MANSLVIEGANVTISIKGLALSHFNQETQRWETRFLRHVPGHNLTLTVKKNGVELFSGGIEDDEKISIRTNNAAEVPSHYNEGNDNDFSRLIDFNSPEMCGDSFKFNDRVMTSLSTSDACFYAKTISFGAYTIRKNEDPLATRRVGVITGGDIVSLGQTEITFFNTPENNLTLPAEAGVLYEIIFDNDCSGGHSNNGGSDFDRYSDVIDSEDIYTLTMPDVTGFQEGEEEEDPKKPPCTSGGGGTGGG